MEIKKHKIIVVTPAWRKMYLDILSKYILSDDTIDEWHLWDNCRKESDRIYINELAKDNKKIKIVVEKSIDWTNKSVNKFYKYCTDDNTFYIKMDDDIVYLPKKFWLLLYTEAIKEKELYSWWSPIVINNSICTYLLNKKDIIKTNTNVTAQAWCSISWKNPIFCENLHNFVIKSIKNKEFEKFNIKENYDLNLVRFSINTIGFFWDYNKKLWEKFCPLNVDDEEYISATLPIITWKSWRLIWNIFVSHFSFFTQEEYLLKNTNILNEYANIAGLNNYSFSYKITIKNRFNKIKNILFNTIINFLNETNLFYSKKQKDNYKIY